MPDTYCLQEWAAEDPCPRCGASLYGKQPSECTSCRVRDEMAREENWAPEKFERFLSEERAENLAALAQERARVAGKSDQQLAGELEEAKRERSGIEPVISPMPACLSDATRTYEQYSEQEQKEAQEWAFERRYALPLGVPTLEGGSPLLDCEAQSPKGDYVPGYVVGWAGAALSLGVGMAARPEQIQWTRFFPYKDISSLTVQGSDVADRRVTKPRVAALGLFSLAAKKERKSSYFLVENYQDRALLLRVGGLLPVELQAQLAPLLSWYETYQAKLAALHELWSTPTPLSV